MKCCDNCGIEAPDSQQQGSYIDYGWSLNWLALGHYGGFTDCLPEGDYEFDSPRYLAHLCHDCCIKLLNVLPGLAKLIFPQEGGGHPNMNDHDSEDGTLTPPCCQWAWTWKRSPAGTPNAGQYETYFGTADGGWKKIDD